MDAKNWKLIAAGYGLDIPDDAIERITPTLNRLEADFRPLAGSIPDDVEPAVTFGLAEEAE